MKDSNHQPILITGSPGSGKTLIMHKLLQRLGGLDLSDEAEMRKHLLEQDASPILVNLKNCASDSFDHLLRGRRTDAGLDSTARCIYLLDGLDELSDDRAVLILNQICETAAKASTHSIVISCRSGNPNRITTKSYFPKAIEFHISDLDTKSIDDYFTTKNDSSKTEKLLSFKNSGLVGDIKDVLLLKLFWETIETLDAASTIIDLFEEKIRLLLSSPFHSRNIESLNLPTPKREAILSLNEDIAYDIQDKFQFRLSHQDLLNRVLEKFPRVDYRDANQIVFYLADIFFESAGTDDEDNVGSTTYIYKHRRFQEYFFLRRLFAEYQKDPKVLRTKSVVGSRDLLNLFLIMARRNYESTLDIPALLEINTIDVYLGNGRGYGADEPYFLEAEDFVPALAGQNKQIFNELLADENFEIRKKLPIDLRSWAAFRKCRKEESLGSEFDAFRERFNNPVSDEDRENTHRLLQDQFESYIFLVVSGSQITAKKVLETRVRPQYKYYNSGYRMQFREDGKEKLVKSFLRVVLPKRTPQIPRLIPFLDDEEFQMLLEVCATPDFLQLLVRNDKITDAMRRRLKKYSPKLDEFSSAYLFFKQFFNLPFSPTEIDFATKSLYEVREHRKVDWRGQNSALRYALLSFATETNKLGALAESRIASGSYYSDELGTYAGIYTSLINLLQGTTTLDAIARDFLRLRQTIAEKDPPYLGEKLSKLWAQIFHYSNQECSKKKRLAQRLVVRDNGLFLVAFNLELLRLGPQTYVLLADELQLAPFEAAIVNWDADFPMLVNTCFQISLLFARLNVHKSREYIQKGIIEGMLRLGWRRDVIISYHLVDALAILVRSNWITHEKFKEFAFLVFDLTLRVNVVADGKETWRGPYNVIELAAENDLEIAEVLTDKLYEVSSHHDPRDIAISAILTGKVAIGKPISELEMQMTAFREWDSFDGKVRSEYFYRRIDIYLKVADSDLYTDTEKMNGFNSAMKLYKDMLVTDVSTYMGYDSLITDVESALARLSKLNRRRMPRKVKSKKKERLSSEDTYIKKVLAANTIRSLRQSYVELGVWPKKIVLTKSDSWNILVGKTFELTGNLRMLWDLFEANYFPEIRFTANSEYFHLGLAAALRLRETRSEAEQFLFHNSGHRGFLSVLQAYAEAGNRKMAIDIFDRFIRFADFLVN